MPPSRNFLKMQYHILTAKSTFKFAKITLLCRSCIRKYYHPR